MNEQNWYYANDLQAIVKVSGNKVKAVADFGKIDNGDEYARRILACVKACAGIPTELLEAMPNGPASLLPMYAALEKQLDDLLRISDMTLRMLLSEPDTRGALFKAENMLREAIASVKGGAR
jgi:hypothetical protein